MKDQSKTKQELIQELTSLRQRIMELEQSESERKRAEEDLRRIRNIQSLIMDNSVVGIGFVRNRIFEWVNSRLPEMLGLHPSQVQGSNTRIIYSSDEAYEETGRKAYSVLGRGEWFDFEITMPYADGATLVSRILGKALDPNLPQEGSIWIFEDITARIRSEAALRESDVRYRTLVETTGDLIYTTDRNGFLTYMNPTLEKTLNYNHAEWNGKVFTKIVAPECIDLCKDLFRRAMKGELIPVYETVLMRKDGTKLSVEFNVETIYDSEGKSSGRYGIGRDITARKHAEDALKESERRLHSIVDGSPIPAFVIGKDHRIIYWNKALEEMSRIKAEEVVGTCEQWKAFYREERPCMADLLVDQADDLVRQWYSDKDTKSPLIEGAYEATDFFPTLGKDGKWLRFTAAAIRDSQGLIVAAVETLEDITERIRSEEALRESEGKYRELVENANSIILRMDTHGIVSFFNEYASRFFGFSRDEMIGRNVVGTIVPAADSAGKDLAQKILDIGIHPEWYENSENENMCKDGTRVWVAWTNKLIIDDNGQCVEIMCIGNDITKRKRAEEESRRLASVVRHSRELVNLATHDGTMVFLNDAGKKMLGISEEEIAHTNIMKVIPEHLQDKVRQKVLISTEEDGYWEGDLQYLNVKTGGLTDVNARVFKIAEPETGALQLLANVSQDITERKFLEARLRQAQKMEAIGTLAGGIAHDFNNILSAIMGYTDMALNHSKVDDRLRHYINQVHTAGKRATDLVKQILAFSRQSDQKPRPLKVSRIIKEVLKLLRASLPTTIKIRQDIHSDQDTVLADPSQLHQILMNLCTNAAQAMRETKGELKVSLVSVKIKPDDSLIILHGLASDIYLKLTVSDTGSGIAHEIIDRIFDPFFTTKKAGEGTGMGLSVVHGIVKSYNGAITVESVVGKGTEFHVYLPLLKEEGEDREIEAEADIKGGKERILFVDDEEMLVQLGKQMLSDLGYEVIVRTSSLEALEFFRYSPDGVDIVVTDLTMPHMTGIELAREIMRIRPGMPVVLCTGFSAAITPESMKSAGMRELILKPIIKRQIAEAVRRALDYKE